MPLILRSIEPVNISRGIIPRDVPSELECCTSRTLAHIMLQLSSLAKQSEDLFADLHYQCCHSFLRASHLEKRIETVKIKIIQLNPIAEEVSLQDINLRTPFKSNDQKDQQFINRDTRPTAITDIYNRADPAPALNKLDVFREDGRDSMKFYTDPNYFFELWCFEVTKDAENQVKKQKQKIKHSVPEKLRTIRQPKSHHGLLDKHSFSVQRKSSKLDKSHITLPQAITSCSNPNALLLHQSSMSHASKRHDIISEHGTMQRPKNDYSNNAENKNLRDKNNLSSESMRSNTRKNLYQDSGQTLPRMFVQGSQQPANNLQFANNDLQTYSQNKMIRHQNEEQKNYTELAPNLIKKKKVPTENMR